MSLLVLILMVLLVFGGLPNWELPPLRVRTFRHRRHHSDHSADSAADGEAELLTASAFRPRVMGYDLSSEGIAHDQAR